MVVAEANGQALTAAEREGAPSAPMMGFVASFRAFVTDFAAFAGRQLWLAAALVAVGAVVDGLGVVILVPMLGVLVATQHSAGGLQRATQRVFASLGLQTPFERLLLLLGVFAVLMLVRAVVVTWRDIKLAELQIGFQEAQRTSVTDLLARARWDRLAQLRHARITHLMSGDVQRVSAGVNFLLQSTVSVVMLAVQCVTAIVLSPALAAVALALVVVIGLTMGPMLRRAQRLGRFVTNANLSLLNAVTQFLGGLKLAMSQNLQGAFAREFRETLNALTRQQIESIRQRTMARLIVTLLSSAVGATIVLVGFGVLHVPTANLIILVLLIQRMGGPVQQVQQGLQQVALALPAYETVSELKAELAGISEDRPERAGAPFPEGAVVFEAVSFVHAEAVEGEVSERGVSQLNVRIEPGDFVGVAGPSGAGKTTFADLLVGLFPPQAGRISVGGQLLEGQVLAAWREGVAYVSQDPFLFHDTVRRNLAWASPGASEAEMWRALEMADAAAVVRRMDQGLDSVVGERGMLVSGGERQRIALARAVLRRPRLLVLDEATNAVDVEAERALIERLGALTPRPTIVMIAHRPESLQLCRAVLRLEDGAFVDGGMADGHAAASGAATVQGRA